MVCQAHRRRQPAADVRHRWQTVSSRRAGRSLCVTVSRAGAGRVRPAPRLRFSAGGNVPTMLVLHNRALNNARHLALLHHVTMNRIESHAARLLVLAALFVLAGCAGTHVKSVQTTPLATQIPAPRTVAVIVENVAPPLQDASAQKQQLNDAHQVINRLNEGLIAFLKSRNLTIVSPAAHPDLTLHCNVLEVRGGTEWLRILIGYGAGRAALRTRVTLFGSAVTAQPLVIF